MAHRSGRDPGTVPFRWTRHVITHIWFTIAAQSANHLKEVVIRAYWDGNPQAQRHKVPVGDFFGLNLGQ